MGLHCSFDLPQTCAELSRRLQAVREDFPASLLRSQPAPAAPPRRETARALTRLPFRRSPRAPEGSTGGERIYAVGDIHGRLDLLEALVRRIAEDAAGRAHTLVFCGDYIDRGPSSAETLEWLLRLQACQGSRVRLLKGNHEQALLRFIEAPELGGPWIAGFGGAATLNSYDTPAPAADMPEALTAARDQLLDRMPAAHLRLLQGLEPMVILHDYAFVHAGISPDAPLCEQTESDLLWARDGFLAAPGPFEKIIVHGHTWTDERPTLLGHRIGVDTGAYETGVLTAVRIRDGERQVLQALDAAAKVRRTEARALCDPRLVSRPADYANLAAEAVRAAFAPPTLRAERVTT